MTKIFCMTEDIDTWIAVVSNLYKDAAPDMRWQQKYVLNQTDIESDYVDSFTNFINFPLNLLGVDELFEAKLLSKTNEFEARAHSLLTMIDHLDFANVENFFILSLALQNNAKLIAGVQNTTNFFVYLWCLGQAVENDAQIVAALWNDKLMIHDYYKDQAKMQGTVLLLDYICHKWSSIEMPPLDSDKYETIFAYAFGNAPADIKYLAEFILPRLNPHVAESNASHLFFRRMLPYCAMENRKGRKAAFNILEEILGHHSHSPSCISTWMSLHPYCVAASNNLLVDIERKGITTTQLKPLLRQLIRINKLLLSRTIKFTEETKMELPRSLWRVEFPPPDEEVQMCTKTCKLVLSSYESKWKTALPALIILLVSYFIYVYL